MRSESLSYFLQVVECGSLTQAAKQLFVSQQGLSKALKSLEKDLGCRLFVRDGSKLHLTSAGRALVPYAQQCLEDVEQLKRAMEPFSRMAQPGRRIPEDTVTLHAAIYVVDSLFSLLNDALSAEGLSDINIVEESYSSIISQLEGGRSPSIFALCVPDFEVPDIRAIPHVVLRPLFETEMVLVGSSQFIHPDKGAFSLERVAKLPVIYYNDPVLNWIIREMFRECPLQNVITHASSLSRISDYVARGKAVTFSDSLSAFLTPPDERVGYAPIEGAVRMHVGFAYLDNTDVAPEALAYIEAFDRCFRERCALYLREHPFPNDTPGATPMLRSC